MEPFSPEFRRLLKQAHPELRDADIDQLQELSAKRFLVPPEDRSDEPSFDHSRDRSDLVRTIDHQISELKQTRMPHFDRIAREYAAMLNAARSRPEAPKVTIKPKG